MASLFGTVETASGPAGVPGAKYYVSLSLQRIEHTAASWAFGEQVLTMAIEWRVTNQAGQTILADTIISEGRGRQGNIYTYKGDTRAVLGRLMDDTFAKARDRLAPVLRPT